MIKDKIEIAIIYHPDSNHIELVSGVTKNNTAKIIANALSILLHDKETYNLTESAN